MNEINEYVPDIKGADPASFDITNGASHQDEQDHVWNHGGWCVTISHFWDPDLGPNATMNSAVCDLWDANAWEQARLLWGMALGQYYAGNKHAAYEYLGHIAHLLGDMTVPAHAHFDMHAPDFDMYDDVYMNGGHDTVRNLENELPEFLTYQERWELQELLGMVQIPNPAIIPNGDIIHPLYWLFYTTAQIGGYYPSDGDNGNSYDPWNIDPNSPYNVNLADFSKLDPIPAGIGPDEIDNCDYADKTANCRIALNTIRKNTYLYAIRAVAALYKLWADTVARQAELTVVLDQVRTVEKPGPFDLPDPTEVDWTDPTWINPLDDPDYFARVWIGTSAPDHSLDYHGSADHAYDNGVWFRNEGEQTSDTSVDASWIALPLINGNGESGWAFANDVGLSGLAHVEIEFYDDDTLVYRGFNYEHWDIYDEEEDGTEKNIWLDVNLDACRARTPGAIGGDLSMTCGVQGSSAGDSVPIADIKFRILAPNTPPTVHLGDDQTANEGDTVMLSGTFEDPDPDDLWQYEWHMESSTNGQLVSDVIGGSSDPSIPITFQFVPCDNGVYTFSLTVRDNHGAEGFDTVVVTVLDVPPTVDAPYISNQPNAEFILPVVHEIAFAGSFTDPGTCDTHTAVWDWSDGPTSDGDVAETDGSGTVTGSHIFSMPGDYEITLTVTDDDGGVGTNTTTIHIADAGEALDIFNAYLQSLPEYAFKNNAASRKKAFANKFVALADMLLDQEYLGMINLMNNDMRPKFDGLLDGAKNDDWIIADLAIQAELCQKVDDITNYLQYLLSANP
jgi:hypothetical protein